MFFCKQGRSPRCARKSRKGEWQLKTGILRRMLPYLIAAMLLYYGVPAIAVGLKGQWGMTLMVLGLLLFNTLYCFFSGFLFTMKNGFRWYYPVLLGMLFIPIISTFYNSSAAAYAAAYVALCLLGCGVAGLVKWLVRRKNSTG